jgi:hypothetical protein
MSRLGERNNAFPLDARAVEVSAQHQILSSDTYYCETLQLGLLVLEVFTIRRFLGFLRACPWCWSRRWDPGTSWALLLSLVSLMVDPSQETILPPAFFLLALIKPRSYESCSAPFGLPTNPGISLSRVFSSEIPACRHLSFKTGTLPLEFIPAASRSLTKLSLFLTLFFTIPF